MDGYGRRLLIEELFGFRDNLYPSHFELGPLPA
jgi:hypothetical protein